jgi:hypothetical protein
VALAVRIRHLGCVGQGVHSVSQLGASCHGAQGGSWPANMHSCWQAKVWGGPASRKTARQVSENVDYVRSFAMSVVIEDDIPEDFEPSEEEIQVAHTEGVLSLDYFLSLDPKR